MLQKSTWHLDKTFNISHAITTIAIVVSLFSWGSKIDTRISLVEQQLAAQARLDEQQDKRMKEAVDNIRSDITLVSMKLDRLIERKY
jgi:hypothetical protein